MTIPLMIGFGNIEKPELEAGVEHLVELLWAVCGLPFARRRSGE